MQRAAQSRHGNTGCLRCPNHSQWRLWTLLPWRASLNLRRSANASGKNYTAALAERVAIAEYNQTTNRLRFSLRKTRSATLAKYHESEPRVESPHRWNCQLRTALRKRFRGHHTTLQEDLQLFVVQEQVAHYWKLLGNQAECFDFEYNWARSCGSSRVSFATCWFKTIRIADNSWKGRLALRVVQHCHWHSSLQ